MFICEKSGNCCNYKYADKLSDLDAEDRDCPYLIEVASVVHAHWVWKTNSTDERECVCSNCDEELPYTFKGGTIDSPYIEKEYISTDEVYFCPHCGARMSK